MIKQKSPYTVKVDSEITLRIRTKDEALELFNLVKENKKHLNQFLYWVDTTKKVSDTKAYIEKLLKTYKEGTGCDFGIYFKDTLIGSGGFINISKTHRGGEIGYWISQNYEGKGIITKAVKKMIEIGKKKYRLHRIVISMDTENTKSRSIPKKLGFTYEGTHRDLKFYKKKFRSIEVWSLLI